MMSKGARPNDPETSDSKIALLLAALTPGFALTVLGLVLWIASATLLYQIALPVMALGILLMLGSVVMLKSLSKNVKMISCGLIIVFAATLYGMLF